MHRGDADEACMCPWIASLPEHVHLPLFHYSEAELKACEDADLVREALSIRESAESVYEVHSPYHRDVGDTGLTLHWAVSL